MTRLLTRPQVQAKLRAEGLPAGRDQVENLVKRNRITRIRLNACNNRYHEDSVDAYLAALRNHKDGGAMLDSEGVAA